MASQLRLPIAEEAGTIDLTPTNLAIANKIAIAWRAKISHTVMSERNRREFTELADIAIGEIMRMATVADYCKEHHK